MNNIPFLNQNVMYQRGIYSAVLSLGLSIYQAKVIANWISLNDTHLLQKSSDYFCNNGYNIDEKTISKLILSSIDLEQRLSRRIILKFFFKVLLHSLFRFALLFRSKVDLGAHVMRAYVENVEVYFQERGEITSVLVYPFPLGFLRQLRYVYNSKKTQLKKFPAGQIYTLKDVSRVILSGNIGDLCRAERRAAIRSAYWLRSLGVSNLYMSEEYNPTMFVHNKVFRRLGGSTCNIAHGVGMSIPFSYFDQVEWMTKTQCVRYSYGSAEGIALTVEKSRADLFELLEKYSTVVFYGQRSITASPIVDSHEKRVIQLIQSRGIRVIYKPHPNQPSNVSVPKNCSIFSGRARYKDCLYVSGYSTAIYEMNMIDCCFISSNQLRTHWLFEYDEVEIYNIDT